MIDSAIFVLTDISMTNQAFKTICFFKILSSKPQNPETGIQYFSKFYFFF